MTTEPIVCIGIDPGAAAGVAAVAWTGKGRPELLALGRVRIPSPSQQHLRWCRAAMVAVSDVWAAVQSLDPAPSVVPVWVEQAPPTVRAEARRRHQVGGMAAWLGLGGYMGRLEAYAAAITGQELYRVEHVRWIGEHDRRTVRPRKHQSRDDPVLGWHRLAEAGAVVEGATEALSELADCSVKAEQANAIDCAEAILIAAAGCLAQFRPARPTRSRCRRAG